MSCKKEEDIEPDETENFQIEDTSKTNVDTINEVTYENYYQIDSVEVIPNYNKWIFSPNPVDVAYVRHIISTEDGVFKHKTVYIHIPSNQTFVKGQVYELTVVSEQFNLENNQVHIRYENAENGELDAPSITVNSNQKIKMTALKLMIKLILVQVL